MPTGKAVVHWIGCINAIKVEILVGEKQVKELILNQLTLETTWLLS